MTGCCAPKDYDKVFDRKTAGWYARQYRRKGLDPIARQMVEFLRGRGVSGASVLEVGGGIGAIQLELLRAGAARAVNVELSPSYEEVARELLEDAGLADRVERRIMDFAHSDGVAPADIVIMHRVVCCYPDMPTLVGAAASRATRYLALSFPRDARWNRLAVFIGNLIYRLRRNSFRAFVHSPQAILNTAARYGFRQILAHRGWIWRLAILEKQ